MKRSDFAVIVYVLTVLLPLWGCDPDIDLEAPEDEFQMGGSLSDDDLMGPMIMMDDGTMVRMDMTNHCRSASDCGGATPACFILPDASLGECVQCTESTFCPEETPFCLADNQCGAESDGTCRTGSGDDFDNGDCESIDFPYCLQITDDGLGICVQCVTDEQCSGRLGICGTSIGHCVSSEEDDYCEDDAQCGLIRRCDEMQACVAL